MSSWTNASAAPMITVMPPISRHRVEPAVAGRADREAVPEDRVEPGAEVDAGDDHRGRVDQRRDRCRAGHRVGQPGVQRELTRLADDREQQRERASTARACGSTLELDGRVVDRDDVERAGAGRALHDEERHDHADDQPDVAGARGEEGLERGVAVRLLLPPVPDQHERAEADELPADEHLERVVGDDEQQHRRGEEAERRVEVREPAVAAHVLERVHVHEQRDERDDEHHHHGETVDLDADGELEPAVLEPGEVVDDRRHLGSPPSAPRWPMLRPSAPTAPSAPLLSTSSTWFIHWASAAHDSRNEEPTAAMPTSTALPRKALAEQQDHDEREAGIERNEPRLIEEEHRCSP